MSYVPNHGNSFETMLDDELGALTASSLLSGARLSGSAAASTATRAAAATPKPSVTTAKPGVIKASSALSNAIARTVGKKPGAAASAPTAVKAAVAKTQVLGGTTAQGAALRQNTLVNAAAAGALGGAVGGVPGALLGGVLGMIMSRLGPDVDRINARLLAQDLQTQATQEHRAIVARRSFEDTVKGDLAAVRAKLGDNYYAARVRGILDPSGGR